MMTQYKFLMNKFKEPNGTEPALMGVLTYPILMASDILLYDASFLSVGEDQLQHLELCNDIKERMNKLYSCNLFPTQLFPLKDSSRTRIMDLQDPSKKMSKSSESKEGVLFLSDSSKELRRKIMKAKTDSLNKLSLDKEGQPGIYNLLEIMASFSQSSSDQLCAKLKNLNYKNLKEKVCEVVIPTINKFQENYSRIEEEQINLILKKNTSSLKLRAKAKLDYIYSQINSAI
ncbi:hypothetical protein PVNG_02365 [Plasmodium vivax North Korean]|uniref:tryptophan--tRNA ligase n=1 Tax=Plasmodium vivax North Korean TaxID=1035514 RepID=A0A0J9TN94_PLAVI|nr:hypothetical protein PVNG_02365 [Plasmodium vivax North Korean]